MPKRLTADTITWRQSYQSLPSASQRHSCLKAARPRPCRLGFALIVVMWSFMLIHLGASKAQQTNPALQGKPALAIVGYRLEFASGGKLLSRSAGELSPPKAPV